MALLSVKKKTVSSIMSAFKKTVTELETHENYQHEEIALIDHKMDALMVDRALAQSEAHAAATCREKLDALLG